MVGFAVAYDLLSTVFEHSLHFTECCSSSIIWKMLFSSPCLFCPSRPNTDVIQTKGCRPTIVLVPTCYV